MIYLSPSRVDQYAACPGSYAAEKGLQDRSGPYADEGGLLHAVMALEAKQDGLTAEQKMVIRIATAAAAELVDEHLSGSDEDLRFVRERKCAYQLTPGIRISGVLDWTGWMVKAKDDGRTLVIDWKFGRDPVDRAEVNRQLRCYALLAAMNREYGFATSVTVAIVQPRVEHEKRVSVCRYTAEDLETARKELIQIGEAIAGPDARRIPGASQCKWCKAAGTDRCPESKQALVQVAADVPAPMPTGAELGRWLTAAKVAAPVIEAIEAHAKAEILAGRPVPGWTLTEPMKVRSLPSVAKAWEALKGVVSADEFMDLCRVGVGALQDLAREKKGWRAKDAKDEFNRLMGDAVGWEDRSGSLREAKE